MMTNGPEAVPFNLLKTRNEPAVQWFAVRVDGVSGRQGMVVRCVVVQRQRNVLEIVLRLCAARSFYASPPPGCWQQQSN